MTRRSFSAALTGAALIALVAAAPAGAQMTVYDPTNYASNVMQAARALEQINNQIRSLQNEAQMLVNQGKNLTQLPYSALQTVQGNLGRVGGLLQSANRLAYDVQAIDQEFRKNYPGALTGANTNLVATAQQRWLNSVAAYRHALDVQASVVSGMPATRTETGALVGASQGAVGVLQASQAGNQLLAIQSQQLADVTALLAAQGRAAALEQAERAEGRAQAQEQFRRFTTDGQGYQQQPVKMFHQ